MSLTCEKFYPFSSTKGNLCHISIRQPITLILLVLVLILTVPCHGFRSGHEFELVTLSDQIICTADHQEAMQSHLVYILKVNTSVYSKDYSSTELFI